MGRKFISWRRVSTGKQAKSGLGLEAQKSIIKYFVDYEKGVLIADYEECHTGTSLSTCTELKKAMEQCKRDNAILIIAKVDRFRTVVEALQILDYMGEGNIMFCDLPTSDRFSLTLYTALAEREALITSIRTKQALAVKKAQGCKLGAASDKYKESYKRKAKEKKREESIKRGTTRNERFIESRDTQVFLKVIKKVFPDACQSEDICEWEWDKVNTKGDAKSRMVAYIKDYKEFDESGSLFKGLDLEEKEGKPYAVQMKLNSRIYAVRRAVKYKAILNIK